MTFDINPWPWWKYCWALNVTSLICSSGLINSWTTWMSRLHRSEESLTVVFRWPTRLPGWVRLCGGLFNMLCYILNMSLIWCNIAAGASTHRWKDCAIYIFLFKLTVFILYWIIYPSSERERPALILIWCFQHSGNSTFTSLLIVIKTVTVCVSVLSTGR